MTDVDAEVARFRHQLDHTTFIDAEEFETTVNELLRGVLAAKSDSEASKALLLFASTHDNVPTYSRAVIDDALAKYALYIVHKAGSWDIPRLLRRFNRLALAARISTPGIGGPA